MKEFNLELAKAGHPVCTRGGRTARIICFDCKGGHPIVALIVSTDGVEIPSTYTNKGEARSGCLNDIDLMMASEKGEGWLNIYIDTISGEIYPGAKIFETKKSALRKSGEHLIDTIKIEYEF